MKNFIFFLTLMALTNLNSQITIHPENPKYFLYNNAPVILIGSTEHYGAIINRDFDYKTYLKELNQLGLNLTREFAGDYIEAPGDFCIENNTLSPAKGRFIAPWLRSEVPGYYNGGNKFDLNCWNPEYFRRLHGFMQYAEKHNIVVELVMFFAGYTLVSAPMFHENNINNTNKIKANQYLTLKNGNLLKYQEAYCRKIVKELNQYDNLIFDIANEPWFGNQEHKGFSSPPSKEVKEWIEVASGWIVDEEKKMPKKHLISLDYTNEGKRIPLAELKTYFKHIDVFNSHYDRNAEFAKLNYDLNYPITFNETGLMPMKTPEYRIQAWKFIFSGGSMYNNLDFTFQVGHENGTGNGKFSCVWYTANSDTKTKLELANLLKFVQSIHFLKMIPDFKFIEVNYGEDDIYPMTDGKNEFVVYFKGGTNAKIKVWIPNGNWMETWINPADLNVLKQEVHKDFKGGSMSLRYGIYQKDILLYLKRDDR